MSSGYAANAGVSAYHVRMKRAVALFDICWLPIFLLLSVTWLFAPALHHVHYGSLAVISSYEAVGRPWAWLFRTCDVLAAAVLAAAVWRYKVLQRARLFGVILLAIALLAAIDGIFPLGCPGRCTSFDLFSGVVHDAESVIAAVVVGLSALAVWWRARHWLSIVFSGSLLVMGLAAVSGLASHAQLMVVHFVYELVVIAWTAWLVHGFAPKLSLSRSAQAYVRRAFGWLALGGGVCMLAVTVAHRHAFGSLFGLAALGPHAQWLTQHGVIAGLLLLYIARQLTRGQLRAAVVMAVVLSSLVINYALYQPHPVLLGLSLLSLVLLWRWSSAFGRNIGPLPLAARLRDFATVLIGILAAACVVLAVAVVTGKQHQLYQEFGRAYRHGTAGVAGREERLSERSERHVREVINTLSVGLIALLVWTLFRPAGRPLPTDQGDRERARRILDRYSNSSEDFFKLWPHDKQYFFSRSGNGFVAYKATGSVAFALADPVTSAHRRRPLVAEFADYCKKNGWRVCFLLVQESSKKLYAPNFKLFRIGSSAVISVEEFVGTVLRTKWWRWQVNRAQRLGLTHAALRPPHTAAIVAELRTVSDAWLSRAAHQERGFALGYFDMDYLQQCTLHVLRNAEGGIVAFANEVPVCGDDAQRTVDLIRFAPSVDGAMSILVMSILRYLYEVGGVKTFDLGFVPLAKLDSTLATIAKRLAAGRFSMAGLEQFKGKFQPDWHSNFIAYDGDLVDLALVLVNLDTVLKVGRENDDKSRL